MLSPLLIKGTETEFFPTWKREIDEKQTNLFIIQQTWTKKLGFSVIDSNVRCLPKSNKTRIAIRQGIPKM